MSIQYITKYNGAELCEFCGECQSEILQVALKMIMMMMKYNG